MKRTLLRKKAPVHLKQATVRSPLRGESAQF